MYLFDLYNTKVLPIWFRLIFTNDTLWFYYEVNKERTVDYFVVQSGPAIHSYAKAHAKSWLSVHRAKSKYSQASLAYRFYQVYFGWTVWDGSGFKNQKNASKSNNWCFFGFYMSQNPSTLVNENHLEDGIH